MPDALRESILTVEDVVAVDPGPWVVSTSAESLVQTATAVRACRRLRFSYRSHNDVSSRREIQPYAVLHANGRWYLIGDCLSRKALRSFRLDRLMDLEVCTATLKRPATFDPQVTSSSARLSSSRTTRSISGSTSPSTKLKERLHLGDRPPRRITRVSR